MSIYKEFKLVEVVYINECVSSLRIIFFMSLSISKLNCTGSHRLIIKICSRVLIFIIIIIF